ncbi:hypothetical protein E2C01_077189 [Portunus trituberculatus]|uniref:Uncharacterized protein n=1 Tax=Portunus trituberculatus TaxID=210409 RepID=A0A5B7IP42_PORTR|nr:hypothetical protein [Portunus trituberculatus]
MCLIHQVFTKRLTTGRERERSDEEREREIQHLPVEREDSRQRRLPGGIPRLVSRGTCLTEFRTFAGQARSVAVAGALLAVVTHTQTHARLTSLSQCEGHTPLCLVRHSLVRSLRPAQPCVLTPGCPYVSTVTAVMWRL